MEVRRLLFPTDFSESAEQALPHALEISRNFDAHLTVLHVRTPFGDDPGRPEFQSLDQGEYELYVEEQLEKMPGVTGSGDRVDTAIVRDISAAPGILEFAEETGIDMVVMGIHTMSKVLKALLGSSGRYVLNHLQLPIYTQT